MVIDQPHLLAPLEDIMGENQEADEELHLRRAGSQALLSNPGPRAKFGTQCQSTWPGGILPVVLILQIPERSAGTLAGVEGHCTHLE